MGARSSWKGFLRLSLVSVPVKGYSAGLSGGAIRLNQLHAECHNRIKYQKTCPIHGPVSNDEIVSGYEYAKGQFVVIDPAELKQLRSEADGAITIDAIIPAGTVDPLYFTEKTYYLLPEGKIGERPYALIQACLAEEELQAVARVVLFGRDDVVLLRPHEGLLSMTSLKYEAEVMGADALAEELEQPTLAKEELALTKSLLHSFAKKKFSLAEYKDTYIENVTRLIESKVEGKEIVSPPPAEEPEVINLMDALKKSVARAQRGGVSASPSRRKMVASTRKTKGTSRAKRKSG